MNLIKRLAVYFVPYWRHILFSLACMGVVGATAGITAWLVKPVLDDIFIQHDAFKLKVLPLAILVLYLVKGVCRYAQSYVMRWVGEIVILKMRDDLTQQLQLRELTFFEKNPTGTLIARVTSDVDLMYRAVPDLIQMLRQGFTVIGLLVVLFTRDWKLAAIALLVMPLAAYPVRRISVLMRSYARRGQERVGGLAQILQESFSGIEVVKTFGVEEDRLRAFHEQGERLRTVRLKSARVNELTAPFMEFLGAVSVALIIWYGGSQVLAGTTTTGSFFSFLTALFMLYEPLKRAGKLNNSVQQALAAAERVFDVIDRPIAPCETQGGREVPEGIREIVFDDVWFAYGADKEPVLRGVSLTAGRGEVVAIVGASGAGKSTLVKLLPRFYDVGAGSIRLDGLDLRQYSVRDLRRRIAVVTQSTFLFNDSVRNNIKLGRPEADDAAVEAAARAAHAHHFIIDLPQGYDTVVGERGDMLSGGQRQRVAIARAILKDAPILILDEATSALDSESEGEVQAAMEELMRRRTTFVIAHRLSTVRHAAQIVVLRQGQVVERGSHAELLEFNGEYANLCRLQFGEGTLGD